jgi:cytochrome c oxidase assembly factor CtaG/putative copper export protein
MILMSGNLTTDPLVSALGTLNKSISLFAAFTVVGVFLSLSFLIIEREGKLQESALQLRQIGKIFVALWLITSVFQIVITLAIILESSISEAFNITMLNSFLTQVELGKYLAFQTLLIGIVLILINFARTILMCAVLLMTSLVALVAPVFQSHAASSGSHSLAIGSLVVHVVALSLWVGGIFALIILKESDRQIALPRFSQLALWAAIAVVGSGVANAWARLNFASAWSSSYARIVIVKTVLTAVLLVLGYRNRKSLQAGDKTGWSLLSRIIVFEAFIMGCTLVLGSWLSSTQPPEGKEVAFSPALATVGYPTPQAPSIARLLTLYDPDAFFIALLITLVALYIKGVMILKKRGDSWPVGRTFAFSIAIAALDFATSGGLGVYSKFSFEYHMIAHMVIGMLVPIGLVLGAPITLALRSLPQGRIPEERGVRGMLISFLHSRYSIVLTNPITALALFDGSLFVLYFTNLFGDLMQSHAGHLFMNLHFLLTGFLFFHVIIGIDPNPRKIPHIVRIVMLFAAMSIHAFFAISLLATTTLIDRGYYGSLKTPWLGDLLADQHAAGAIAWGMGEIPIIFALIATFIQWMRDDSREAKRIDRNEARMAAMGEPDELAQYNNYLNTLQRRDEREGR